jgi:lysozyme family protein
MADIIDDLLKREGGLVDNPADKGGRTAYGISEKANPQAWADGKVTSEEAKALYTKKYIQGPGFDKLPDDKLRTQLIDFGVNSGPGIAIIRLQEIIGVETDGVLGPHTVAALSKFNSDAVNNALVIARIRMICRIVKKNPSQLAFLLGWIDRALSFLV